MSVILLHGFWLGGWAWDDVASRLREHGLTVHAPTLPGAEPTLTPVQRATVTRADQVNAVLAVMGNSEGPVELVAHSGSGALAQVLADRVPERISRLVYVDSGPLRDGIALFGDFPADEPEQPMPSWEELEAQGSSTEGLDDDMRARFRRLAVPVPGPIVREPVHVTNPARLAVPTTFICTSVPSAELRTWADPTNAPFTELGDLTDVTYVDLPTGHWPMFSRPIELADLINTAVQETSAVG